MVGNKTVQKSRKETEVSRFSAILRTAVVGTALASGLVPASLADVPTTQPAAATSAASNEAFYKSNNFHDVFEQDMKTAADLGKRLGRELTLLEKQSLIRGVFAPGRRMGKISRLGPESKEILETIAANPVQTFYDNVNGTWYPQFPNTWKINTFALDRLEELGFGVKTEDGRNLLNKIASDNRMPSQVTKYAQDKLNPPTTNPS